MSSLRARPARRLLLASVALVAALGLVPAGALAEQRVELIDSPSTAGNIDLATVKLNKVTKLQTYVILPDGYDANPTKDYPVLYMFGGIGDNAEAWARPGTGNFRGLAPDFPGIVVTPELGRGYTMDWYRGGTRKGAAWSRYFLEEVVPQIQSRYRIKPGRQWHALGGVSSGAYGALNVGGRLPGYFGSIVALSPLVDSQEPAAFALLPSDAGAANYDEIWGPWDRNYASANNPMKTADNVAKSRIYLYTGNGTPDPRFPFTPNSWSVGVAIESFALAQNSRYSSVLRNVGGQHALKIRGGVHDWPYWRRELPVALKWDVFGQPLVTSQAAATAWTYKTIAEVGNAWGLGYRFAGAPSTVATFQRAGQTLKATGLGKVTISPGAAEWDASGAGTKPACTFTADLPFTKTLPSGC